MRGQRHALTALYPQKRPGTHCTGDWVGSGPVWTGVENLAPTGIRSPDRPASIQSLYRLSYPARNLVYTIAEFCPKVLKEITKPSDLTASLCAARRTGDRQHTKRQRDTQLKLSYRVTATARSLVPAYCLSSQ